MFCGECGTQNPDTNQFCKNCGKPLKKPRQATTSQPAAVPVPLVTVPPQAPPVYYQPPPSAAQPASAPAGAPVTVKPPLNKMMLVLGIIGVLAGIGSFFRYPYLLGILAIVLGGVVMAKPENRRGAVMVVAGLAILIGLSSIVFDLFYLMIMPPVTPAL
jgi:hypothetical protein